MPTKIAYITSRFPKLTETFILFELLGLERSGIDVQFFPLVRERAKVVHAEAIPVLERARFLPFLSWRILASQFWWLSKSPRTYLSTWGAVLRGTWRNSNFLAGGIGIFPKVAHAARGMVSDGVTHVHGTWATHAALAGFIIHRLTGIPYSFTARGSDLHVDRTMLAQKVAEAAFVVANSEFNREVVLGECGRTFGDKIVVIHSGIDTSFFSPAEQRSPTRTFTILCVGTLHEVKGQRYLIAACERLAAEGVDFQCQLIGDGPDRAKLTSQIQQANLTQRVYIRGARTRAEIAHSLREADVLVAPSVPTKEGKREGIPNVLMEACACGLPVVASRLSGIPELVEDGVNGLLVAPRDDVALAAALRRLYEDPGLRQKLGAAGREKVLGDYDAYKNAARLAACFTPGGSNRSSRRSFQVSS